MDRRNVVLLAAVIVVIGVAAVILLNRPRPSEQFTAPARSALKPAPSPATPPTTPTPEPIPEPTTVVWPRLETVMSEEAAQPVKMVRVRAERVLATVNGVSITLKDLMPLGATEAGAQQTLSPDMYKALLDRAIERELTFQAARAQGVELTDEQAQQLEQMRASLQAQYDDPAVIKQLTMTPERIEFDIRDATGQLLQANLGVHAGLPSPHVTPELVDQYYQEHKTDYGELPSDPAEREATWHRIDLEIRQKLAPDMQAAYREAIRTFMDHLKSSAQLTLTSPVP